MMAAWMTYALVMSLLIGFAALLAERLARIAKLQTRVVWIAALLLSLLLPVSLAWKDARTSPQRARIELVALASERPRPMHAQSPIAWIGGATAASPVRKIPDQWLVRGWIIATSLVFGSLLLGQWQLRRRLRDSRAGLLADASVTITDDIGPAVMGIFRPQILIPRWLLQADSNTQHIALAHEREHLRSHDVRIFCAVALIVALLPWNLPLWWQLRRLRFAMEVDCDARVLRQGYCATHYSTVLLNVATRLVRLRVAVAGLAESGSSLEKRISIMHAPTARRWRLTTVILGSCCLALVAAATNVTVPDTKSMSASSADELPLLVSPVFQENAAEEGISRVVSYFHPQLLAQKQAGRPYVWLVLNEAGQVAQTVLEVRPSWDTEAEFAKHWGAFLQRAGVTDDGSKQQIVMQMPVGPNYVVVAWVMQAGAIAQDSSAPELATAPEQARSEQERILSTVAAQRVVIDHFDPVAIAEGVPAGQELWFLIDAGGKVLKAGRRSTIGNPETARMAMQKQFPGIKVGYVTRGTAVKDVTGKRVPVSWQWLERDSSQPPP